MKSFAQKSKKIKTFHMQALATNYLLNFTTVHEKLQCNKVKKNRRKYKGENGQVPCKNREESMKI
jgi:hypothetical protein